jgi:hypothetical protein
MRCIDISEAKSVKAEEGLALCIPFKAENVLRFPIEVLYYYEQGFKEYVLEFSYENFPLSYTKLCDKIRDNVYRLLNHYDLKIYVKGFPPCIFERMLFPPLFREQFKNKLILLDEKNADEEQGPLCSFCSRNTTCNGFSESYREKLGNKEFQPFFSHETYVNLYREKFEFIESEKLKAYGEKLIQNFEGEEEFGRKLFVFVKSFSDDLDDEASKNRFVYYIHKRETDFDDTFSFLQDLFEKERDLSSWKEYFSEAIQFAVSFAEMNTYVFRKTLYVEFDSFPDSFAQELSEEFKIDLEEFQNSAIVGFDFREDGMRCKLYEKKEEVSVRDVKDFVQEFPLESKRRLLNVLNSRTKNIKGVLFDKKFKDGECISKRIDFSMQFNNFKLYQLSSILGVNMAFLEEQEPYTLSLEIRNGMPEKINVYYSPKILIIEDEEDEGKLKLSYT